MAGRGDLKRVPCHNISGPPPPQGDLSKQFERLILCRGGKTYRAGSTFLPTPPTPRPPPHPYPPPHNSSLFPFVLPKQNSSGFKALLRLSRKMNKSCDSIRGGANILHLMIDKIMNNNETHVRDVNTLLFSPLCLLEYDFEGE